MELWTAGNAIKLNLTVAKREASLDTLGSILPRDYITVPGAQLAVSGAAHRWEYAISATQALVVGAGTESKALSGPTEIELVNSKNVGSVIPRLVGSASR
jgi:hypothetical protein